jgi:hypothetical protein
MDALQQLQTYCILVADHAPANAACATPYPPLSIDQLVAFLTRMGCFGIPRHARQHMRVAHKTLPQSAQWVFVAGINASTAVISL